MQKHYLYDANGEKLFDCVNVRAFGAVGDGTTDDTAAIQAALDARKTGGTILFPFGVYKLTASVYFYSDQALLFEQGATLLQGAAIDNLMMNRSTADMGGYEATHNVLICGATFDGGSYSVNNTLFGICHSRDITLRDCCFRNAFGTWHDMEINSSKNVLVEHCRLEGSRKTGANGCLIQIDSYNNTDTWPWGNGKVDGTVSHLVEIKGCCFSDCTLAPAIGNHSAAVVNGIRIHDNIFEGIVSERGAIAFQSAKNVDVYGNTFIGCGTGVQIATADGTNTVHDNRFLDASAIAGDGIRAYNNMLNGSLVA